MSELKQLQDLLRPASEGKRLGIVESVLDSARIVVRLSSGARRRVYGQAPTGARVLVQGEQLVSRVATDNNTILTIA